MNESMKGWTVRDQYAKEALRLMRRDPILIASLIAEVSEAPCCQGEVAIQMRVNKKLADLSYHQADELIRARGVQ